MSPVAVTSASAIASSSSKEFHDIDATIECGFTVKRLCDMIKAYSQMDRTYKYSEHNSIIRSVWPNGWVLVYKLRDCGFESSCSHLNFRFLACFIIRVLWHSGNYRDLANWMSDHLRTEWFCVPVQRHSLQLQISRQFWASNCLTLR